MKRFLIVLTFFCFNHAQDSSSYLNQSLSNAKNGLWQGAGGLISGFTQSFGVVPADKVYSYMVWNDTPYPIYSAQEQIISFFGAQFDGQLAKYTVVLPFQNSGDYFNKEHLLFTIWLVHGTVPNILSWEDAVQWAAQTGLQAQIGPVQLSKIFGWSEDVLKVLTTIGGVFWGAAVDIAGLVSGKGADFPLAKYAIFSKVIPLLDYDPDDHYYYRTYLDSDGMKGEYLGINVPTSQFAGVFYNKTSAPAQLNFLKDDKSYTVTLEPQTFSLLSSTSTKPNSIRPAQYLGSDQKTPARSFTFKQGTNTIAAIPIATQGIAGQVCDPTTKKCTPGDSLTYTYEVYTQNNQPAVGMQGLAVGNHTQPVPPDNNPATHVIRDINPVACSVWAQSASQFNIAQQTQSTPNQNALDLTEQVWIYYQTKDYTYQQKITPGSVTNFTLIRPQLSEGKAWLYVTSLQTNDDKKAVQFLQRLAAGTIGAQATSASVQNFTADNLQTILTTQQPNLNGIINDTNGSGISGTVLLVDGFFPRGMGTGTFYYTVPPALLMKDQLINVITPSLTLASDTVKQTVQTNLSTNIAQWITLYNTQPDQVKQQLTQFLQQYGNSSFFKNPQATGTNRTLNDLGTSTLNTLLTGPLSIKNPPLLRQTGINNFIFTLGHKPDNWPQPTKS